MRCLLQAKMETAAGNQGLIDGTLPKAIQHTLETLKPEAAYFGTLDGRRTAWIVFDLEDPADMPRISEPLFGIGADVQLAPVMVPDDLERGLSKL
jgi:hypothetical protein